MPILRPRYDRVVILCPIVVTGGAEAIHQLAAAIDAAGGAAEIAYYGAGAEMRVDADRVLCRSAAPPKPAAYARYPTRSCAEAPLTARSLVVAPEAIVHRPLAHRTFQKAIWWLSVDNGRKVAPFLDSERARVRFFQNDDMLHFYQSDYARDFLAQAKARRIAPLSDYTNPDFLDAEPAPAAGKRVAYFPRKGAELAAPFFAAHRDLETVPIQGLDQAGVRRALRESAVFIDFGHHPGKDRVPREAAMSGAIVFLHERGAAQHYLDHPLDPFYLFTAEDLRTGSLRRRVDAALADVAAHRAAQAPYRTRIALERDVFDLQVRDAFFDMAPHGEA